MKGFDVSAPFDAATSVEKRAAEFFQHRRFWDWGEKEEAELNVWLAESAAHRVAWLRLESSIAQVDGLVADAAAPSAERSPRRYWRFAIPLLAAASLVLAVPFGLPLLRVWMEPPDRTLATNVGGRAVLKFVDGTEIDLNTSTALRYHMTNEERTVWLDHGEAYFRVTHNAADPFTVVAAGHRITDLGTEFLVRNDAGNLDVALLKGRAQLASEKPRAPATMLTPGYEAVATPVSLSVIPKTPQELEDELAWRSGMLVFRNTRLADVVREFNRYNTTKLVIADPSIAGEKITANARTDDYESFLQMTEDVLKLRVDRTGNVVLISRGFPGGTKKAVHLKHSF